ncbi:trimeric intracellular cation channel family protein [Flavihumibacter fluvii]|uniref:trimeric intracellular cation channel family protein n=1 Tax=Flavihumibacter fluvii TaxID=2838157 RepID=UPI001BDDFB50|nr:trimeric intracellular cation channel family protein [Flavihumibacter fluvii]ULQ53071.1 trimeric intracellular cation channel family protein [Flavihumibacter fluvii]
MNWIPFIEISGTFAFAVSGAFAAMRKELDPFGVLIMAFVPAIGGGTLRDILINDLPVAWLRNTTTIWVILVAAIVAMFFAGALKKMYKLLFLFDAVGLGLFTIIGIEKGIQHHYTPGVSIALGIITGCFGGVLRDVLLNDVPLLFQKEIYAMACLAGGIFYFLLKDIPVISGWIDIACILIIVTVRLLAVYRGWSLPLIYKKREQ